MAKRSRFDTSFDFGANVARKQARSGGKKKRTAAQKAAAALYLKPRRR
jgi:hypothetical protein